MPLTDADVVRIARLAHLSLSDAERGAMLPQLNSFFRLVEQMNAVNTQGVQPLYTPLSAVQEVALRLRPDGVSEDTGGPARQANQASAPAVHEGLYLVPRVIE